MSVAHQFTTLRGMAVLRQWDDSTARGYREIAEALERVEALPERWRKDAEQYARQVEEARRAGTPYGQMLSMATALRQCANELEKI